MKRVITILALLFPLSVCAQNKGFTIQGCVINGVSTVPNVYVALGDTAWNNAGEARTNRNGTFTLSSVPEGSYMLSIHTGFFQKRQKIDVNSSIALDTILVEEDMLGPTIWYLQKTDTAPSANPYYLQYLDYRRAIDALNINYSRKTHTYNVDSIDDANSVLASLHGLSIEEGWLLDVYYSGGNMGGNVIFYTRRTSDSKIAVNGELPESATDLMSHMEVEFTPEGIWSAYQLVQASCYLPKYWHGGYFDYCGIFTLSEVRHRSPALRDSLTTTPEIDTRVDIIDANHATVTAYWWNDWVGLFLETIPVERVGNTVRFILPDNRPCYFHAAKQPIVSYDCGIQY